MIAHEHAIVEASHTGQNERPMQLNEATIWIVEDNENNALVVQTLLQVAGIRKMRWLRSGSELMAALDSLPPTNGAGSPITALLLDIQLPGEDGYTILQRIRALPSLAETKIVAVTASVMPEDVNRARVAGFDGFIGKPIDRHHFDNVLHQIVNGSLVWRPH